jgi:hypothetical protein
LSRTDPTLIDAFIAGVVLPLHHLNARRGVHYLKLAPEAESYWAPIASRTGGLERIPADQCDGPQLLARLGSYWAQHGDANLPKLVPHLLGLRSEIIDGRPDDAEEDSEVSDFVYPLF